jgi:tetratricopeptide (TPR) repeat protein
MRICVVVFVLLALSGLSPAPSALAKPVSAPDSVLLADASKWLALEQYDSLFTRLESARAETPGSAPWIDLLEASLILTMQVDFGDTLGDARYVELSSRASKAFHSALEQAPGDDPQKAAYHEALGILETLEAQHRAEVLGKLTSSLAPAMRGAEQYSQALELDSTRLTSRAALDLYRFWKSHALRILSWTPFVSDNRDESLASLARIVHSTHTARFGAASGLLWALVESGHEQRALSLADTLLDRQGELRNLLEPAGKAAFLMKRWKRAAELYGALLESVRGARRRNEVREVGVLHRLGHIMAAQQRWGDVIRVVDEAHAVPLDGEQRKRKRDDLERLDELRQEAKKHLAENE